MPSGKLYRWEFAKRGQELAVDVTGPLILDHIGLMLEAAGYVVTDVGDAIAGGRKRIQTEPADPQGGERNHLAIAMFSDHQPLHCGRGDVQASS